MDLFQSYTVEILKRPFEIGDQKRSDRTARIHLLDSHGNKTDIRDYAFIEPQEIYSRLSKGQAIDLNNSYIKGFSLSEFREQNHLPENAFVEFSEFSAINSFFDSDHNVDFSNAYFKGDSVHFINSIFTGNELSFLHAQFDVGDEDFTQCIFNCKSVNFQYAKFNKGDIHFDESIFHGESLSFINSDFNDGKVYFPSVDFGKTNLAFQFASFGKGDITFEKSKFYGEKIDFSKVEFGAGRVDFRLVEFGNGHLSFDECEIENGKFRFRRAKFGSARISFEIAQLKNCEISFDRTEFGNGELSFYQADCGSVLFNYSHINNYVDLRFSHCGFVDLSNTIVRDIVDLSNDKGQVRIESINFSGMRNLGRLFLDWYDNDVKRLIYSQKDTSVKMKAEQFRMLKEEFRSLGQYTDEDKAYLEFKRLELKDRKERALRNNKLNAIWFYPMYWGEYLIFDQIGHYATNPMRVLVSMIISFCFITALYVLLILTTDADIVSSLGDPDKLPLVTKSVYHSAITFLTIGYGDYYPSGSIRWLSGIEGFVGLFLMSYFTVAFVRKVLR